MSDNDAHTDLRLRMLNNELEDLRNETRTLIGLTEESLTIQRALLEEMKTQNRIGWLQMDPNLRHRLRDRHAVL